MKQFISGCYYKGFYYESVYIFKVKAVVKYEIYFDTFYICDNIYYTCYNEIFITYKESIIYEKLDSIDTIIHLLPDNNPDKINFLRRNRIDMLLNL